MSPGRRVSGENPVGLVVHQRERAVAVERDDAVAHAADDVPEEPILAAPAPRAGTRAAARAAGRRGVGAGVASERLGMGAHVSSAEGAKACARAADAGDCSKNRPKSAS